MAQNTGTFCVDELKRDLRLEGVFPRFQMPPQQLGKLPHGEKLLLLLLDSGSGKEKSVLTPPRHFSDNKLKRFFFLSHLLCCN